MKTNSMRYLSSLWCSQIVTLGLLLFIHINQNKAVNYKPKLFANDRFSAIVLNLLLFMTPILEFNAAFNPLLTNLSSQIILALFSHVKLARPIRNRWAWFFCFIEEAIVDWFTSYYKLSKVVNRSTRSCLNPRKQSLEPGLS